MPHPFKLRLILRDYLASLSYLDGVVTDFGRKWSWPDFPESLFFVLPALPFARSRNFIDDQEISLKSLGGDNRQNTWDHMSEDVVLQALQILLDVNNYPLMVMCGLGRHPTGTPPSSTLTGSAHQVGIQKKGHRFLIYCLFFFFFFLKKEL